MKHLSHVVRCVWREAFTDRTFMVAAGLAFFVMFSLLPALAIAGLMVRWIVDEDGMEDQIDEATELLPEQTPDLFEEFLVAVPETMAAGLGLSVNLLVVFWTVQRASSGLITALNVVYDEDERRGRARRELVAVAIAVGALIFLFIVVLLGLVVPIFAERAGGLQWLLPLRWPILVLLFFGGLCLLYAYAPCKGERPWGHIAWGAAAATFLWLVATMLFVLYMNTVGGWDVYYGSITAAVVLMTWVFISAYVILLGAEVDAQLEAVAHPEWGKGRTKDTLDRREHG